jgi:hypothetical protein
MTDPFADLADSSRWVAWRNEKRGQKTTKIPYSPSDGKKARADDPATWGTRSEAEARARLIVNGLGGGIGIELGDIGADTTLGGIDLDSCFRDGPLAPWAADILAVTGTYAERSPSGTGIKNYFFLPSEDVRPFLDRIGVPGDGWGCRRNVSGEDSRNHGPAIECYLAGRYFTVTENVWPGAPNRIRLLDRDDLNRLALLIPRAKSTTMGKKSGSGDTSRSAIAYRIGLEMRRDGRSYEEFVAALKANEQTKDWYSEKGDARQLRRIWQKAGKPRAEWLANAQLDHLGDPRPNLFNAMLALRGDPLLARAFAYDEMLRARSWSPAFPAPKWIGSRGRRAMPTWRRCRNICKSPASRRWARRSPIRRSTCAQWNAHSTRCATTSTGCIGTARCASTRGLPIISALRTATITASSGKCSWWR